MCDGNVYKEVVKAYALVPEHGLFGVSLALVLA